MTSAGHLATIDRLCLRPFPETPARSGPCDSGPGFHVVALARSEDFWEDDGTRRLEVEEQYEAERDALGELLASRWGAHQHVSLFSVLSRAMDGEDIPEPWHAVSNHTPDLYLWRAGDRWIGLGISQWDDELPFELLLLVTTVDPP
ncbi:hypothetical protein ACGFMM_33340 [Streptomyces sp. NPDC048604]|uniref:hypothetical protein n=1 Tax=Streptomyces sp. NPDC048604 TaxID=3365578 RepID=UPI003718ACA5